MGGFLLVYRDPEGHTGVAFDRDDGSSPIHLTWSPDLRGLLPELAQGTFAPPARGPALPPGWRHALPVASPGQILAVGRNYAAHAAEMGDREAARGREPIFFAKLPSILVPSGAPIRIPAHLAGTRVDHEGELAVVLGRRARRLSPEEAHQVVAGYTLANDVTARDRQQRAREKGHPWLWAKNQDTFLPMGPVLVPRGWLDPHGLTLTCRVDGEVRQQASTGTMLHTVAELVAIASHHVTLEVGDILLTGTPAGVGPLHPGAVVEVEAPGLGVLRNPVEAEDDRPDAP